MITTLTHCCAEHYFNKKFKGAIVKSAVGYTGGKASAPSYQAVCTGSTGHAEAIQLDFDSGKASYPELVSAESLPIIPSPLQSTLIVDLLQSTIAPCKLSLARG